MKIIALNGSPRKDGNTETALHIMGKIFTENSIEFEILNVGVKPINGCTGCNKCKELNNNRCVFDNDFVNLWIEKLSEADGIILASPVYYSGIAGNFKSALDRTFYAMSASKRYKIATAICAVRRTGGSATLDQLGHYLSIGEMIIISSSYWNVIHGREKGEVLQDTEGVQTLQTLADNMAWMLKTIKAAAPLVPRPESREKMRMSFIR